MHFYRDYKNDQNIGERYLYTFVNKKMNRIQIKKCDNLYVKYKNGTKLYLDTDINKVIYGKSLVLQHIDDKLAIRLFIEYKNEMINDLTDKISRAVEEIDILIKMLNDEESNT